MSELLQVYFLTSNIRTCFFYFNDPSTYADRLDEVQGIKIKFGNAFESTTFGSLSLQSMPEVPSHCIGVTCLMASRLGLNENDKVLISKVTPPSLEGLQVIPRREEDYVVLLSCRRIIEMNLLNMTRVIAEGQILPIYVFTNFFIDIEIGKLKPSVAFGRLERFTEVTVIHPSEKCSQSISMPDNEMRNKGHLSTFISDFNMLLRSKSSQRLPDNLPHKFKFKEKSSDSFLIWPSLLLVNMELSALMDKWIILINRVKPDNCFGPCSVKMLCKVKSKFLTNESSNSNSSNNGNRNNQNYAVDQESNYVYSYVVCLHLDEYSDKRIAFCPPHIMKKLNVLVGSEITVEDVSLGQFTNQISKNVENAGERQYALWGSLDNIKQNTIQCVLDNIRFNCRVNTLIVGGMGTGKTFLLNALVDIFTKQSIHIRMVECKRLHGKKIEKLIKQWTDALTSCCLHRPSVLILDDLHALTKVDEEDNKFDRLYSNRIVEMVTNGLRECQERFNVTVIATTVGMAELFGVVSAHGPRQFQNVQTIEEMTAEERNFVLQNLIADKHANSNLLNLNEIAESTKGYTVQDLNDLVEKAVLKALMRSDDVTLNQSDLTLAVAESVPQILRAVNPREKTKTKWEDVGGMDHQKKVLLEVFSWPSKYPALLASCPLRLQRGVLLYGAPGTGKTLLASALANKCGLNFISVKGPEVLSKYVGASEEGVRNLFLQAQKTQPCLLFFDEFDSLAPKRGHDNTGVTDRVVNQLLTQLDGVEALTGVWVLAATSRPDLLDPALLRPGRLDKMIFCDLPNRDERSAILSVISGTMSKDDDVDLEEIANKSVGYTGADLQAVLYNAQLLAIKGQNPTMEVLGDVRVQKKHLLSALADTKPSLSKSEKLRYQEIYRRFVNSRKNRTSGNEYSDMKMKVILA